MSNNGRKGGEDAATVQKAESEVRLSLDEKAPPPKQNSAGQPSPPSTTAQRLLRAASVPSR